MSALRANSHVVRYAVMRAFRWPGNVVMLFAVFLLVGFDVRRISAFGFFHEFKE
jgi:hypothetical protein